MFLEWENNSRELQINSRKFEKSRKFQNKTINNVKQISLSHVIIAVKEILMKNTKNLYRHETFVSVITSVA